MTENTPKIELPKMREIALEVIGAAEPKKTAVKPKVARKVVNQDIVFAPFKLPLPAALLKKAPSKKVTPPKEPSQSKQPQKTPKPSKPAHLHGQANQIQFYEIFILFFLIVCLTFLIIILINLDQLIL